MIKEARMAKNDFSKEVDALAKILDTLSPLDEQQRAFVLDTVNARLGIVSATNKRWAANSTRQDEQAASQGYDDGGAPNPKEFLSQKKPANGVEQIVCLAYYLSKYRSISAFKTVELTKLNTEAAGDKISNPSVFTRNAVSQNGYLVQAGGGKKQITARGEAVVEALPDREKVKQALEDNWFKGRKKVTAKSKSAKAKKERNK